MIHDFQKQIKRIVSNEQNNVIRQLILLLIATSLTLVVVDIVHTQSEEIQISDNGDAATVEQLMDTDDELIYLPIILKPREFLMIADFDTCTSPNNVGGGMGAACPKSGCPPPDQLFETYPEEPGRGCVACLEYHIKTWSAFWLKLNHLDMSPYDYLVFDIRGTGDIIGTNKKFKIEIKRDCYATSEGTVCYELEIKYVGEVTSEWQEVRINLSEFAFPGWAPPFKNIQDWSDMEELVFVVEGGYSGKDGFIYLDNVRLEQ